MGIFSRKIYFIEKQLQTKYIVITILLLVIYTVLFVFILIFPYIIPLTLDYPLEEQAKAARMLLALHKSIWPALITVILIMGAVSIRITHKFAGPIYRFKRILNEVAGGNLDITVKLRAKDDLKDLAEGLNLVIGELRGFVRTLQADHEAISACINDLEAQVESNQINQETGRALIRKMQESRENISLALNKYSIHD